MENNKTFDFKKQLKVGARGEELFLSLYPQITKADGIKYDFTMGDKTIELKTDTYSMDKTPNMFMEHLSDTKNTEKVGGPWRALNDGVTYFAYMYIEQKQVFWFHPKELVDFMNEYIKQASYKVIRNKGWTSIGYAVPREKLKHLFLENI